MEGGAGQLNTELVIPRRARQTRRVWAISVIAFAAVASCFQGVASAAESSDRRALIVVRSHSELLPRLFPGQLRQISADTFSIDVALAAATVTLAEIKADPGTVWAEFDTPMYSSMAPQPPLPNTPNDPQVPNQFALTKIGASGAWARTHGSASIRVAVLDSGVDLSHPDLVGKVDVIPGCGLDPSAQDDRKHGTEVSGIIAANTDNNLDMAGIGWDTRILSVRVLTSGIGSAADVAAGVRCAADNGAKILNLSLQGAFSQSVADAIVYAQSKGALIVAAAGNAVGYGIDPTVPQFPANQAGVMGTASTDSNDELAYYSYRGPWVDIAAPGDYVTALAPGGGTTVVRGTSFSAPYVAGAAALVAAAFPGITADGIKRRLELSATPIAGTGTNFLHGRLQIDAALAAPIGGYWTASALGNVTPFADYGLHGNAPNPLVKPIVGGASTPTKLGYWLVASDGGIFSFGDAQFHGSAGGIKLNKPIVGMAATPTGNGYWLVASDGGVFSYGDAAFFGSTGAITLNKPIVGMSGTPTGNGYWLVASDGGMFAFGGAQFFGSMGAVVLNKPVVGMAASATGNGYWLVASDGGVFSFGDATFLGSTGDISLNQPVVAMKSTPSGNGYWMVAADGGVFSFGDAAFFGASPRISTANSIVALIV